jgi:hypothetical protein
MLDFLKNVLDVLSEYSQEVGRAGRDGSGSNACLYFNATDVANDHVLCNFPNFMLPFKMFIFGVKQLNFSHNIKVGKQFYFILWLRNDS